MDRNFLLKELYQGLWMSADFESDLEAEFPTNFHNLKYFENRISIEQLEKMYSFMRAHPVFA